MIQSAYPNLASHFPGRFTDEENHVESDRATDFFNSLLIAVLETSGRPVLAGERRSFIDPDA